MLVTSIFSFSQNVFKIILFVGGRSKLRLCGIGLNKVGFMVHIKIKYIKTSLVCSTSDVDFSYLLSEISIIKINENIESKGEIPRNKQALFFPDYCFLLSPVLNSTTLRNELWGSA